MDEGAPNVRSWIASARLRLKENGVDSSALEAQLLAAHVLRVERSWLFTHPEEPFPDLAGESLLARRLNSEPLAYILGYREFYGRRFTVRPGVLIPRQDTEILIETALDVLKDRRRFPMHILDMGTGSGCIAITLKLESPVWNLTATDISTKALDIARLNGEDLKADVTWIEADGFVGMDYHSYDAIVTNPPYIGLNEPLSREVKDFEPHPALFSGASGLEFYSRLSKEAHQHLNPSGLIMMEVGYEQADAVKQLFVEAGWTHEKTVLDLAGIPRVVVCSLENTVFAN